MKTFSKKTLAVLSAVALLFACLPAMASDTAELPTPVFSLNDVIDDLEPVGTGFNEETVDDVKGLSFDGSGSAVYKSLDIELGSTFSISFAIKNTAHESGFAIAFAAAEKASAGHFEAYFQDGTLWSYAPAISPNGIMSMQNGKAVNIMDGKLHKVVITYDGNNFSYYDNNEFIAKWPGIVGSIPNSGSELSIGSLLEGGMNFAGFVGDIRVFNTLLNDEQIAKISGTKAEEPVDPPVDPQPAEKKLLGVYAENGMEINAGTAEGNTIKDFDCNIGNDFTLSGEFKSSGDGIQILFAKGAKFSGHYEVYMHDGTILFYSPDLNGNNPIGTTDSYNDGNTHAFAITYDGLVMKIYIDGALVTNQEVTGTIAPSTSELNIGFVKNDGFGFTGYLKNIKIYNYHVSEAEAIALSTVKANVPTTGDTGNLYIIALIIFSMSAFIICMRKRTNMEVNL